MFDDQSELDNYHIACKSLEDQLDAAYQDIFDKERRVYSLNLRNQGLIDIVQKLVVLLEGSSNHV